ncbi:MAG: hypothetical protein BMS9Abin05_0368 [Rhodothermia bacterium]|nr:MAG: hypothetical protein BMS9Abin05_0368 [Rhodothermia bacterium]
MNSNVILISSPRSFYADGPFSSIHRKTLGAWEPTIGSGAEFDDSKRSSVNIMKRLPIIAVLVSFIFLVAADGCSSDPNVEGAKLNLRNKNYDRALENLDIALSNNPSNVEAYQLKGEVLSEKALATPDVTEHTNLIVEMLDVYERTLELDPTLSDEITLALRIAYQNEFQRGTQAFNRGKNQESEYNTSVTYFQTASLIQPDSAGAYVNQAYSLMNGNRSNEAMGPFEMAIEKGDTELDTYRFLASLYQANDRYVDSVDLLEEASEMYPDDVDLQTELLNAFQLAGQIDRAMEMYAGAVERDPDNKLFRYNYGSLLVQVERYDDAIEQLMAALAIDPDYANAHYNLGASYINQAVAVNERVTELDDQLRANRGSMSSEEIAAMDNEINALADRRRELFGQAVSPLEKAKALFEASGDDPSDVCVALFQSYVQTDQTEAATAISECAGFDDSTD